MKSLLEVKNLTKEFNGFKAVNNVSFEAYAGEVFGLLGPNGAGKTTTIRVIATTLTASSGTATVAGFDIKKQPEKVRSNIGVLTTDIGVYERLSGRENLKYYGQLNGMSNVELDEKINEVSRLLDMEDFVDRRASKYSTGMKQKLAIARSVIHDPKVVIFDEPTAGLDVLASQNIMRFMKKEKTAGKLVILSTHEMTDAEKLCDRVAIIHQGKIVTVDTVDSIKEKTQANDLEEAFVKLVHGSNISTLTQTTREKQSKESNKKKIGWIVRIGAIVLIAVGFLFSFLEISRVVFYIFLALGIVMSFIGKYAFKEKKEKE
ncbi:ATP-binding cassette domain-containing protein [Patescibacteria group bacterium]|nr:ATP-binding cassette domain-containing protein [Patescibacteria group bacterium]MBU1890833.1 ATP-binding cassette domain-containing protein [Patescibacteria group bacterium]